VGYGPLSRLGAKSTITSSKFSAQFVSHGLDKLDKSNEYDYEEKHTLSQSIFCRVKGKARLKPLNVFSPISWYASFRDVWHRDSSASINANILEADDVGGSDKIPAGIDIDKSFDVLSWTCSMMSDKLKRVSRQV